MRGEGGASEHGGCALLFGLQDDLSVAVVQSLKPNSYADNYGTSLSVSGSPSMSVDPFTTVAKRCGTPD